MAPTAVQSRITAFEQLAGGSSSHKALNVSPPISPALSSAESLIDAPLDQGVRLPPVMSHSHSPSPSPPNLGRKSSLIDLNEWIIDDGALLKPKPVVTRRTSLNTLSNSKTPTQAAFSPRSNGLLINLESPPKEVHTPKSAPPLPPRKPSYNSLKSAASSSSLQSAGSAIKQSFLYPPGRTGTLTVEPPHVYPPSPSADSSRSPTKHQTDSSISSFHSVSLSSDTDVSTPGSLSSFIATFPGELSADTDSGSLAGSFEDVSSSPLASPATEKAIARDFDKARARKLNSAVSPKLPQRPSSQSSSSVTPSSTRSSMRSPPPLPPARSSQSSYRPANMTTPRPSTGSPAPSAFSSNYVTPIPTTYAVRRPPPPPPSRSSDRSSVQSTFSISSASNQSHRPISRSSTITSISSTASSSPRLLKTSRPTPVPAAARQRYEAVFSGNVVQRRRAEKRQRKMALMKLQGGDSEKTAALLSPNRGRRAAGWRGLSVDLITGDPESVVDQLNAQKNEKDAEEEEEEKVDEHVGKDERLEGAIVKLIWKKCGLDKKRLAEIWNECDPLQSGSLDLDGFVKGMWRIDEELRRVQVQLIKSSSNASLASLASKHPSRTGSLNSRGPVTSYRPPRILLR